MRRQSPDRRRRRPHSHCRCSPRPHPACAPSLARLPTPARSAGGEALLASSTTDLESGAAGLFRLHYLLLPCAPAPGAPPALLAKRVASAEELLAPPLLGAAAAAAGGEAVAAPAPAVAEAVAAAVGRVPLEPRLDPLALSGRCVETVEVQGLGAGSGGWRCTLRER